MPLYLYQGPIHLNLGPLRSKSAKSYQTVGREASGAVGGKLVGAWYCFGDFDFILIADVPNNESMTAISLRSQLGAPLKAVERLR